MRPVIKNRPQVGGISQALLETLDGIVTPIQVGWKTEHNGDGGHTDITATSSAISGLHQAARMAATTIKLWDYLDDASGVIRGPGVAEAGLIIHVDSTPGGGGIARTLYAIDDTGRVPGEIVWFLCYNANTAPGGIDFSQRASAANRQNVAGFANFTGVIGDPVTVPANRVIPLLYLPNRIIFDTSNNTHPWYIGASIF